MSESFHTHANGENRSAPERPAVRAWLDGITGERNPVDSVRSVLADGRRRTGRELRLETGLGRDFYRVAAELLEAGELRTCGDGTFWLEEVSS